MNYEELNINEFIDTCSKVQNTFHFQIIDLKNRYIEPYLDNFQIHFFENKMIDNHLCIFLFFTFTLCFISFIFYLLHNSILLYNNKKQIIKNKYVKITFFETTISLLGYIIYNIFKLYFGSLCIYFIYTYNNLHNNIFLNKYVYVLFYEKIKPQLLLYISNISTYIYTLHNNFLYNFSKNIENYRNIHKEIIMTCKEMNFKERLLCREIILDKIIDEINNDISLFIKLVIKLSIIDSTIILFFTSSILYFLHNSILRKYDPVLHKYVKISFYQSIKLSLSYLNYILDYILNNILTFILKSMIYFMNFILKFIIDFHIIIFKQILYFNYVMLKNITYFHYIIIKDIVLFTNYILKFMIKTMEDLCKR